MKIIYEPKMEPTIGNIKKVKVWDMYEQHYHNTYEVYLVTEGDRELIVNGKTYVLRAGDLAIIEPYVLHYTKSHVSKTISRWLFNFPEEILGIVFSNKEIQYILNGFRSCIIHVEPEHKAIISGNLKQINENFLGYETIRRKIAVSLTVQLIFGLKQLISTSEDILAQKNILRKDMLSAIRYIHESFTNSDLSLQDVLDHVHMSKSRFSELFKQTTGMTYLKYLNFVRATAVRRALVTENDTIAVISESNGFSEVQKMTRVFNDIYGMSPTKYRKVFKNTVIDE